MYASDIGCEGFGTHFPAIKMVLHVISVNVNRNP